MDVFTSFPLLGYAGAIGLLGFCALHIKGLPFAYHVRSLMLVVQALLYGKRAQKASDPVEHYETVLLSDMDYNLHANNTFYPLLGDYVRIRLFGSLYGTLSAFLSMPIHNAGVSTLFLREFRFLDPVIVRARIVSVEENKWLYVLIEYIHGRTKRLHALALTKMVFKDAGRKTVKPREALRRLGFEDTGPMADTVYGPLVARLQAQMTLDAGWDDSAVPATPMIDAAPASEPRKKR